MVCCHENQYVDEYELQVEKNVKFEFFIQLVIWSLLTGEK